MAANLMERRLSAINEAYAEAGFLFCVVRQDGSLAINMAPLDTAQRVATEEGGDVHLARS